jgi:hypothetical protein
MELFPILTSLLIYFQDPTYGQVQVSKPKKSLAEKINRTLDKLSTPGVTGSPHNHQQKQQPTVASTAAWVYPASPVYHHHHRILPYHGTYIHPWESYYTGSGGDFVDYNAYEYPVTSPPATRNNAYCGCYDNLHGTVSRAATAASKRTNGKCKHCQKTKKPSSESALKKLTNSSHYSGQLIASKVIL